MSALDVEIDRVKAACVVREATLTAMVSSARGHCCPSCFHGAKYDTLADKQERATAWLAILLAKRGDGRDFYLRKAIDSGAWP